MARGDMRIDTLKIGGESLAVRKAKELASGARTANQDILKNYM